MSVHQAASDHQAEHESMRAPERVVPWSRCFVVRAEFSRRGLQKFIHFAFNNESQAVRITALKYGSLITSRYHYSYVPEGASARVQISNGDLCATLSRSTPGAIFRQHDATGKPGYHPHFHVCTSTKQMVWIYRLTVWSSSGAPVSLHSVSCNPSLKLAWVLRSKEEPIKAVELPETPPTQFLDTSAPLDEAEDDDDADGGATEVDDAAKECKQIPSLAEGSPFGGASPDAPLSATWSATPTGWQRTPPNMTLLAESGAHATSFRPLITDAPSRGGAEREEVADLPFRGSHGGKTPILSPAVSRPQGLPQPKRQRMESAQPQLAAVAPLTGYWAMWIPEGTPLPPPPAGARLTIMPHA